MRRAVTVAMTTLLSIGAGCGKEHSGTLEPSSSKPTLEQLIVTPTEARLLVGDQLRLSVEGRLSDGSAVDLTGAQTGTFYEAEDPAIVEVDVDGRVRARAAGTTRVAVHQSDTSTDVRLSVTAVPDGASSIQVAPDPVIVTAGQSAAFGVGAVLPEDVVDLTDRPGLRFVIDDPGVATCEPGRVRGVAPGVTRLRVEEGASVLAEATVEVTSEPLVVERVD